MKHVRAAIAATVLAVIPVGTVVATAAPAGAATSCVSTTQTAYGYNDSNVSTTASPPNPGRYVRHTAAVAVCFNTTTKVITSASCTVERVPLKTNMAMIPNSYWKNVTGGAGVKNYICDTSQDWKWLRSIAADECASPSVYIQFSSGAWFTRQANHFDFTSRQCGVLGV